MQALVLSIPGGMLLPARDERGRQLANLLRSLSRCRRLRVLTLASECDIGMAQLPPPAICALDQLTGLRLKMAVLPIQHNRTCCFHSSLRALNLTETERPSRRSDWRDLPALTSLTNLKGLQLVGR